MQALMINMAKEATENDTLIACTIQSYCQKNRVTWTDVAEQLKISEEQLAKLALCRLPTPQNFTDDIVQIANYTDIEVDKLTEFLPSPSFLSSLKHRWLQKRPSTQEQGNSKMIKRRAITFGIALIAVLIVSVFLFSQPTNANANATLTVLSGEAMVTQGKPFGGTTTITIEAGNSLTLSTQDVIKMSANSTAELFLFEGSRVELAENTELELTELTDNESDHQIYMTLLSGHIINRVTKLLGVDDAYEVRTPSSTASVRGTIFAVAVLNDNATEVQVAEGVVAVALGNEVVAVGAGEMVTAVTGKPLNVETSNNSEMLPTATPVSNLTEENEEPKEIGADEVKEETDDTNATEEAEEVDTIEEATEATTTGKPAETPVEGTAISPATTASPPAKATVSPALPTNTAVSPLPTNTVGALPPTNTPIPPAVPTNTPLPAPTNTPVPIVPTNTPVPVIPTNTPVPPPTNTPEPPPPTAESALVTLCHNPGPSQQTKQVPQSAVQGHLNHGDYLGACN